MPRYFFDLREDDDIAVDEEGLDLPDHQHAEMEAALSLSDIVRDRPNGTDRSRIAIEVRNEGGPLFSAALFYRAKQQH